MLAACRDAMPFASADDLDWKPHFFVLTRNKIFYSEVRSQDGDGDDDGGLAGGTATAPTPGGLQRLQSVTAAGDQVTWHCLFMELRVIHVHAL